MKTLNGNTVEDIINKIKTVVETSDTEKWNDESACEKGYTLTMKSGWKLMVYHRDDSILIEVNSMDLIVNGKLPVDVVAEVYKINNIFDRSLI